MSAIRQYIMPAGIQIDFAGTSAPAGWLLCYGQSVLRADYPALFTAIGTTYGSADGTHFTLPDCRGRLHAGKDNMGGSAASRLTSPVSGATLGAVGGVQNHACTANETPVHQHNYSWLVAGAGVLTGTTYGGPYVTMGSTGGGAAHNNVQPVTILNKLIKT